MVKFVNISRIHVLKCTITKGRGNLIVALYLPDKIRKKAVFIAKKKGKRLNEGFKGKTLIFILFLNDGIQRNLGENYRYSRVLGGMKA